MNPYQVTADFEAALRGYCGAPYAVAVNSCTAAILLALKWWTHRNPHHRSVRIPARTYPSVPMAAILAGCDVTFDDFAWVGAYPINPTPVWDCARRFTAGMYEQSRFQCVSFSSSKILGLEQGGAILHSDRYADAWFRKMRFDGRTEGVSIMDDSFDVVGHHCLMPPGIAGQLLLKLHHLPRVNADLPAREYPDLSKFEVFK